MAHKWKMLRLVLSIPENHDLHLSKDCWLSFICRKFGEQKGTNKPILVKDVRGIWALRWECTPSPLWVTLLIKKAGKVPLSPYPYPHHLCPSRQLTTRKAEQQRKRFKKIPSRTFFHENPQIILLWWGFLTTFWSLLNKKINKIWR